MSKLSTLLIGCLIFMSACTQKDWYEQSQSHQAGKCKPYLHDTQTYNECIENTKKPYEDYKKERDEILED